MRDDTDGAFKIAQAMAANEGRPFHVYQHASRPDRYDVRPGHTSGKWPHDV